MARLSKDKCVKNIQYEISVVESLGLSNSSGKLYYRIEQTAGHIDETLYSGKRILLFDGGNTYCVRYWKFSVANSADNETSLSEFITFENAQLKEQNVIGKTYRYYAQILVEYDNEAMTETDVMSRLAAEASNPQPTLITVNTTSSRFTNPVGNFGGGRRGLIESDELSKLRHLKRNVMFWNDAETIVRDGERFLVCVAKLDNTDPVESIDVRFSSYLLNASFTVYVNKIYASMNNNSNGNYDITKLSSLIPDGYNGAITVNYFDTRLENKAGLHSERPVIKVQATIEKYAATGETAYLCVYCTVDLKNKDAEQALKRATITIGAKDIETLTYFHKNVEQKESNGVISTKSVPLNFFYPSSRIVDTDEELTKALENKNSDSGIAEIDEWTLGFTSGRRVSIPRPSEMLNIPQIITSGNLNNFKDSGYYWAIGNKNTQNITFENVPKRLVGGETILITDSFRLEVQNLNGYDNNALLYEPLYQQIYGLENTDIDKLKTSYIYQRLISLSATQKIVTKYENKIPSEEEIPYIYERLYIGLNADGTEKWTPWTEVGRKAHTHMLEELGESSNSMHFTQELYNKIDGSATALLNSPFDSTPFPGVPQSYDGATGNAFITKMPSDDKNEMGITYGLYQKQSDGNARRIDIGGLTLLKPDSVISDDTEIVGAISKELFNALIGSQFVKNIGTEGHKAFVFSTNKYSTGTEVDIFDIVNRGELETNILAGNSISFGFGLTQAQNVNAIAIGNNVVAPLQNSIAIGNEITGDNLLIGIGDNLYGGSVRIVLGRYNSLSKRINSQDNVFFAIGNGTDTNKRKTIFEITENSFIGVNGIYRYEKGDLVGKDIEKVAFNVNGGIIDISEYAEKSVVEEIDRNKVDIGSNFVTRFISQENGTPYDLVSATDPNIEIRPIPETGVGNILYSPEHYLIFPEGFRIDFLTHEESDEDGKESSYEYVEVFIPGTITKSGKALVLWCQATEELDDDGNVVGLTYPILDFNEYVEYKKVSLPNPVEIVDLTNMKYKRKGIDEYISYDYVDDDFETE